MKGFLRSTIVAIVVFALILAVYRLFGGDLPGLLANIWAFLYSIIDGVANIWTQILGIFGLGG
jgi:hypothetical protein